jgi:iron complex transport system ATP-binding protein
LTDLTVFKVAVWVNHSRAFILHGKCRGNNATRRQAKGRKYLKKRRAPDDNLEEGKREYMSARDSPVISTYGLSVGYDSKVVVGDADITALQGQVICLIGPNGSGKSTILRTLSGMLAPVNGAVYIGKTEISKLTQTELAKYMSVVLTDKLNLQMTTAFDVVAMGRTPHTGFFGQLSAEDVSIVNECLRTVGAAEISNRDYMSLSDGEKQKVLIARALAQEPKLIILDEPTSHLDLKHKVEVMQILKRLASERGTTIIFALHDVDMAMNNCGLAMLVKGGKIIAQGSPDEVISGRSIKELFDMTDEQFGSLLYTLNNYVVTLRKQE